MRLEPLAVSFDKLAVKWGAGDYHKGEVAHFIGQPLEAHNDKLIRVRAGKRSEGEKKRKIRAEGTASVKDGGRHAVLGKKAPCRPPCHFSAA